MAVETRVIIVPREPHGIAEFFPPYVETFFDLIVQREKFSFLIGKFPHT
jgi:hypothetical protein